MKELRGYLAELIVHLLAGPDALRKDRLPVVELAAGEVEKLLKHEQAQFGREVEQREGELAKLTAPVLSSRRRPFSPSPQVSLVLFVCD